MTTLNWKRTTSGLNDSVYVSDDGEHEIRKAVTAWGTEWRHLHRDDDACYGWEWCQSYRLLRDAKAGAQAVADAESM